MLNIIKNFFAKEAEPNYIDLVKNGAVIVDVRTAGEFNGGHIKKSINIPLGVLSTDLKKLKDKSTPVITCCASGMRSASAKNILEENGFKEVYNGGGWKGLEGKL